MLENFFFDAQRNRAGLFDLIREFDTWFENDRGYGTAPNFEVNEEKDSFRLCVDLPGVRQEDVQMQALGNQLMITAERKEEPTRQEGRDTGRRSRGSMKFQRIFTLPESIDINQIRAGLEHGVLEIHVPKSPEASPRQIQIASSLEELRGSSAQQVAGQQATQQPGQQPSQQSAGRKKGEQESATPGRH